MKFRNKEKHKTQETPPPAKVFTETQLQEHLKNLKNQFQETQTRGVMLTGAIHAVEMQIKELNPTDDQNNKITNGVK